MEIHPADKQILGLTEQVYQNQLRQSKTNANRQAVVLDHSFRKYIDKALADQADQSIQIEQIRQEMKEGKLDTSEVIRQAAQNILNLGI